MATRKKKARTKKTRSKKVKPTLAKLLDLPAVRDLAWGKSFERGDEYFHSGLVTSLSENGDTITARVRGSARYQTSIWLEEGKLEYLCTCPIGEDDLFCKHLVATALAWLDDSANGKSQKRQTTEEDIRTYLSGLTKSSLVDMLMEQSLEDDGLQQRLLMATAKQRKGGVDFDAYYTAIDSAVITDGYIEYRDMHDYTDGISRVVEGIRTLLNNKNGTEVVALIEYAHAVVEKESCEVDDSSGYMGGILDDLQTLHLAACKKAKPDPVELAQKLFELELTSDLGTFSGAANIYAGVLKKTGLAEYKRLVEAQWGDLPQIKPGAEDPDRYGKTFRVQQMMESIAKQKGDIEMLVAIKSRDLSHAYDFLTIAKIYKDVKQYDKALDWAERGLKAFPKRPDARLRDFLADEYLRSNRHEDAMGMAWAIFQERPSLDTYRQLCTRGKKCKCWAEWRERAFKQIHGNIKKAKVEAKKRHWRGWAKPDHSLFVEIFFWEKDIDSAWQEAVDGGCSEDLWLKLAEKRKKKHPADSLAVYQRQIEPILARTNNEAYHAAAKHLAIIHELMNRLDRKKEFAAYLATVRSEYKRKRNFIKILDRMKF